MTSRWGRPHLWNSSIHSSRQDRHHYNDVIMSVMAPRITCLRIVYSGVYSGAIKENIKAPQWRTGFCAGNSPLTGEFPSQRASNAENVSIWWGHHDDDLLPPSWMIVYRPSVTQRHWWICLWIQPHHQIVIYEKDQANDDRPEGRMIHPPTYGKHVKGKAGLNWIVNTVINLAAFGLFFPTVGPCWAVPVLYSLGKPRPYPKFSAAMKTRIQTIFVLRY